MYEQSNTQLGMTPAQYRKGGRGMVISYAAVASLLGRMMLGATDRGLCFLQFGENDAELLRMLRQEYPAATLEPASEPHHPDLQHWLWNLDAYLAGTEKTLAIPVDVRATAFQLRVWNYLSQIPYGEVRSYTDVAEAVNAPSAVRAVANACAANRVALLVPCHRVVRQTGELGGYRWGLPRKRALLDLERAGRAQRSDRNAEHPTDLGSGSD